MGCASRPSRLGDLLDVFRTGGPQHLLPLIRGVPEQAHLVVAPCDVHPECRNAPRVFDLGVKANVVLVSGETLA